MSLKKRANLSFFQETNWGKKKKNEHKFVFLHVKRFKTTPSFKTIYPVLHL
jgi:hypothetical protein